LYFLNQFKYTPNSIGTSSNSLKDNKKANNIVLEELGINAGQLDNASEETMVKAFNQILKMRDFL
jgi:hypothetical protein